MTLSKESKREIICLDQACMQLQLVSIVVFVRLFIFPNTLYLINTSYKPFLISSIILLKLLSFQILFFSTMAFHADSQTIDGVFFNYLDHSMVVNGVSYLVDNVPRNISDEFSHEEDMEMMFLMFDFVLEEKRRRQALEEQERIIGLAVTMSRIFHRREVATKKQKIEGPSSSQASQGFCLCFF